VLPAVVATCCAAAAGAAPPSAAEAHAFAVQLAQAGPRPAAGAAERRAHQRVAQRFRAANLRVGFERFAVPGKGASRDVIGIRDVPASCLVIVMAHADSVPPAPGADDNASGLGTIVALAPALGAGPAPKCDTWLVATGSEERPYTGQPDHLGASALVRRLRRTNRLSDVRLALSLDEVGRGTRFELRSPVPRARAAVEQPILEAARKAGVDVTWLRDSATGNSDHRELALAGAPATKLGVPDEPVRHTARDTPDRLQRGAFVRVLRVIWPLLREIS
jgi:aminopeptidase YwaD